MKKIEYPQLGSGWQPLDLDALIAQQLEEIREIAEAEANHLLNLRSELRILGR